jgi:hypothetical protein
MREKYAEVIAPVVAERWAAEKASGSNVQTGKDPNGPFRAKIARELYAAMPSSEQASYLARAKEEAAEAKRVYEAAMKSPPSKSPEARDKYAITS